MFLHLIYLFIIKDLQNLKFSEMLKILIFIYSLLSVIFNFVNIHVRILLNSNLIFMKNVHLVVTMNQKKKKYLYKQNCS